MEARIEIFLSLGNPSFVMFVNILNNGKEEPTHEKCSPTEIPSRKYNTDIFTIFCISALQMWVILIAHVLQSFAPELTFQCFRLLSPSMRRRAFPLLGLLPPGGSIVCVWLVGWWVSQWVGRDILPQSLLSRKKCPGCSKSFKLQIQLNRHKEYCVKSEVVEQKYHLNVHRHNDNNHNCHHHHQHDLHH